MQTQELKDIHSTSVHHMNVYMCAHIWYIQCLAKPKQHL